MYTIQSAGILAYQFINQHLQVLLVHPGGPFFKKKDEGVWSIPKGQTQPNEDLFTTAKREFTEETNLIPTEPYIELGSIQTRKNKVVSIWAYEYKPHPKDQLKCISQVTINWPPKTQTSITYPENDRVEFFPIELAFSKVSPNQQAFLNKLLVILKPA